MSDSVVESKTLKVRPITRHHRLDSSPIEIVRLPDATSHFLKTQLRISPQFVARIVRRKPQDFYELACIGGMNRRVSERIRRRALGKDDKRLGICEVGPVGGRIMSERVFALRVSFASSGVSAPVLISVHVLWAGEAFVVERRVSSKEAKQGYLELQFGKSQTLPAGPATFLASLYSESGGQARFRVTCAVLPSNPLSLHVAPTNEYVTGSYSARGTYHGGPDQFKTSIRLTLSNGDASSVAMSQNVSWKFWDGGVGGTLVESGTHQWSSSISVPAHGTWSGTLTFTSPHGSGIYNRFDDKEDMTIEISMSRSSGGSVADTLTARVMVGFGMNVTRVASDTFVGQEYVDLYDAVEVTRGIYEARDITYTDISRRHLTDADAGGYGVIDSESEVRDLFEDWSGPNNDLIDTFICHDFTTPFDGLAGDIPGPTSHSGRRSGVACDKTGFVDASGTKRLSVNYLGMLIGHEIGHYLGLSHTSDSGNLMLSNSGTNDTDLTYDQYRTILQFGWVFIV